MGVVNPQQSNPGDTIEASDINTPVNQLAAVINGNIDSNNIADSAVTTAKVADNAIITTKISMPWISWTPTLTNLSGGTVNYAKYVQIGKAVWFRFSYTLAGAGVTGGVTFTLPVTAASSTADQTLGTAHFVDTGTASYIGLVRQATTTTANMVVINAAGTYAGTSALTSTIPHTWANTDILQCAGMYEAA